MGGKLKIEALPGLDHSAVEYDEFAKDFYEEAPEIFAMDDSEVGSTTLRPAPPPPPPPHKKKLNPKRTSSPAP